MNHDELKARFERSAVDVVVGFRRAALLAPEGVGARPVAFFGPPAVMDDIFGPMPPGPGRGPLRVIDHATALELGRVIARGESARFGAEVEAMVRGVAASEDEVVGLVTIELLPCACGRPGCEGSLSLRSHTVHVGAPRALGDA